MISWRQLELSIDAPRQDARPRHVTACDRDDHAAAAARRGLENDEARVVEKTSELGFQQAIGEAVEHP